MLGGDFRRRARLGQVDVLREDEDSPGAVDFLIILQQGAVSPFQVQAACVHAVVGARVEAQAIVGQRCDEIQALRRLEQHEGIQLRAAEHIAIVALEAGAYPQRFVRLHDGGRIRFHGPRHVDVDLRFAHRMLVGGARGETLILPADVGRVGQARVRRFRQHPFRHHALGQGQFAGGRWCGFLATPEWVRDIGAGDGDGARGDGRGNARHREFRLARAGPFERAAIDAGIGFLEAAAHAETGLAGAERGGNDGDQRGDDGDDDGEYLPPWVGKRQLAMRARIGGIRRPDERHAGRHDGPQAGRAAARISPTFAIIARAAPALAGQVALRLGQFQRAFLDRAGIGIGGTVEARLRDEDLLDRAARRVAVRLGDKADEPLAGRRMLEVGVPHHQHGRAGGNAGKEKGARHGHDAGVAHAFQVHRDIRQRAAGHVADVGGDAQAIDGIVEDAIGQHDIGDGLDRERPRQHLHGGVAHDACSSVLCCSCSCACSFSGVVTRYVTPPSTLPS